MIEVEIKAKVKDIKTMRQQCIENGGIFKLFLMHEDTYYNMPKELRDFKETDEALRIRKSIRYNDREDPDPMYINYYITYKGKKIDTSTKTREEIEVKINNIENMKRIFLALGLREVLTVKKERELYEFHFDDYKVEALIDYVPLLKEYFIEVELLTDSEEEIERIREELFRFLKLLDIKKDDSIRKSYLELILENLSI
jgi:adenylate cyclase class 2